LDAIRAFEKVLEDRGVAFKGVMDDYSSFIPIKVLQRDVLEVSLFLFSNGSMFISSPVSKCSPWELRAVSTWSCPYEMITCNTEGCLVDMWYSLNGD